MNKLFKTYTGELIDPLNPLPEQIKILDIAHSLSMMVRGNGHLDKFNSLAQHCLDTYKIVKMHGHSIKIQLIALLHDGEESITGDMNSVLKQYLPEFKAIAQQIQEVIWEAFEIDVYEDEYEIVKRADDLLKELELSGQYDNEYGITFEERPREEVKQEFLQVFYELKNKMK